MIGVLNEEGESEGLRQITESFAVGRAEQLVESAPLFGVVARLVDFLIVVFGFAQALFVSLYAASLFAHGFALAIQFVIELRALCMRTLRSISTGSPSAASWLMRAACASSSR